MPNFRQSLLLACFALSILAVIGSGAAVAKGNQDTAKDVPASMYILPAADKQHLLQDNFVIINTVELLPKSVLNKLLSDGKGSFRTTGLEGMADPGQPFNASDVVRERLPFRRLIFAGVSANYCVVCYELGGYGLATMVSLYQLTDGQASLVWLASLFDDSRFCHSLGSLRGDIIIGKYYSLRPHDYIPETYFVPARPAK